jgi:hypothetical protein
VFQQFTSEKSQALKFLILDCNTEQSEYKADNTGVSMLATRASQIASPNMTSCSMRLPCKANSDEQIVCRFF